MFLLLAETSQRFTSKTQTALKEQHFSWARPRLGEIMSTINLNEDHNRSFYLPSTWYNQGLPLKRRFGSRFTQNFSWYCFALDLDSIQVFNIYSKLELDPEIMLVVENAGNNRDPRVDFLSFANSYRSRFGGALWEIVHLINILLRIFTLKLWRMHWNNVSILRSNYRKLATAVKTDQKAAT